MQKILGKNIGREGVCGEGPPRFSRHPSRGDVFGRVKERTLKVNRAKRSSASILSSAPQRDGEEVVSQGKKGAGLWQVSELHSSVRPRGHKAEMAAMNTFAGQALRQCSRASRPSRGLVLKTRALFTKKKAPPPPPPKKECVSFSCHPRYLTGSMSLSL